MTMRKARYGDIRAMAEVAAAAWADEELYGHLMHPRRKEYPEDFVRFFERRILSGWYMPNRHLLVGLDSDSGKVVAVAAWERHVDVVDSPSWAQRIDLGNVAHAANTCLIQASSYLWPNRAADPTKLEILQETFPLIAHYWTGPRKQHWSLEMLATHPDFQRRGLAREMVAWGIQQAEQDNVCATLVSSDRAEGFYRSCGFVEVGRANVGPLKENGIKGGAIMFRERIDVK